MATWECGECTTAYAPGAPRCPQCGATDPIREEEQLRRENEEMAKITVAGGASDAVTGEGIPEPVEAAAVTDEAEQVAAAEVEPVEAEEPKRAPKRGGKTSAQAGAASGSGDAGATS